jgi:hypothetical protein
MVRPPVATASGNMFARIGSLFAPMLASKNSLNSRCSHSRFARVRRRRRRCLPRSGCRRCQRSGHPVKIVPGAFWREVFESKPGKPIPPAPGDPVLAVGWFIGCAGLAKKARLFRFGCRRLWRPRRFWPWGLAVSRGCWRCRGGDGRTRGCHGGRGRRGRPSGMGCAVQFVSVSHNDPDRSGRRRRRLCHGYGEWSGLRAVNAVEQNFRGIQVAALRLLNQPHGNRVGVGAAELSLNRGGNRGAVFLPSGGVATLAGSESFASYSAGELRRCSALLGNGGGWCLCFHFFVRLAASVAMRPGDSGAAQRD